MKRFTYLVVLAASFVLAAGAAAAQGSTRPDDRAIHGPGAVGRGGPAEVIRPDDRAWRGMGAAPAIVTNESRGLHPDDRVTHGPGSLGVTVDVLRPDDRAWRGAGPVPTIVPTVSPSSRVDGFDWTDAGIGAAGAIGLALLLAGASAIVIRRQRTTAFS
jgi:hypothetical protein